MAPIHRSEIVLAEDGKLSLAGLPFRAGDAVEVIVLPAAGPADPNAPHPLHGSVLRYDRPFDPVDDAWDADR
ncbi:MAG: hypothetical protein K2X87_24090 [Gemmataceae bacterium]|nr:hypothetical protein [Gemmataceae bacterium]